jgi:hypothetical protein
MPQNLRMSDFTRSSVHEVQLGTEQNAPMFVWGLRVELQPAFAKNIHGGLILHWDQGDAALCWRPACTDRSLSSLIFTCRYGGQTRFYSLSAEPNRLMV